MNTVISSLEREWEARYSDFSQGFQGIMVACSGGPDSTLLFHLICDFFKSKKNFPVALTHINYKLRGSDSDNDQHFVGGLAKRFDVPFFCFEPRPDQQRTAGDDGLQEWARDLRREHFLSFAQQGYLIALGHHRDDLAENSLMRMCRGVSVGAIAGMRSLEGAFWRPLLGLTKQQIEKTLASQGIEFRTDATNALPKYSRNIIRHEVLPQLESLYPGAAERILQTARQGEQWASYIRQPYVGKASVALNELDVPDAVAGEIIKELIRTTGCEQVQISTALFDDLLEKIKTSHAKSEWCFDWPGSLIVGVSEGRLRVWAADAGQKQKAARASQHTRNVRAREDVGILSAGASVEVCRQGQVKRTTNEGKSSRFFCLISGRSTDKY